MEKLRDEFGKKVQRKATAVEDIRQIVEVKLAQMLARNPLRMNYEKKYQEIIAAYNQDKDRATVEDTFARLIDLAQGLDAEQQRAVQEGLGESQLALFDLLQRSDLSKTERETVKQASRALLADVTQVIDPPYSPQQKQQVAARVYQHLWQRGVRDHLARRPAS